MDASKRFGGLARAAKLSPERRREIAQAAARKRWSGPRPLKSDRPAWLTEALWAFVRERAELRGIEPTAWLARCVADAKKRFEAEPAPKAIEYGSRLKKR